MVNKINKKGQVAIWIILAMAIVLILSLLFFFKAKPKISESYDYGNPPAFIESCTKNAILDAEKIIIAQGGFLEPKNFVSYNNVSIEYLCKNAGYFEPCIQQHPYLLIEMEKEIINYSRPIIDECFKQLITELERRNNKVEFKGFDFKLNFVPGRIRSEIITDIKIRNEQESKEYNNFKIDLISPVYQLGRMVLHIANDEAKYCYFEYVGYMVSNPDLKIEKTTLGDSTKIYSVTDIKSGEKIRTAIRGCAIPAGY
ncbi:MAG: hypothetical protein Q7R87_00750 [Nanoarchaeota archaeon]|nr:hypothetical protein [Nanoarchaeota archaeon]